MTKQGGFSIFLLCPQRVRGRVFLIIILAKIVRAKSVRQHFFQRELDAFVFSVCQYDLESLRVAELHHDLAADAAGGAQCVCRGAFRPSYDGNPLKFPLSVIDSLEKGRPLRAVRRAVSGVFDVAAGLDFTAFCNQGRAYLEMGIRRIGVFSGLFSL